MCKVNMLIKYYPLFSEVMARVLPLLKGDKSKENMQRSELALKDMQQALRETEHWLLKREREILFLRWISIIAIFVSIINFILLAIYLSKIL